MTERTAIILGVGGTSLAVAMALAGWASWSLVVASWLCGVALGIIFRPRPHKPVNKQLVALHKLLDYLDECEIAEPEAKSFHVRAEPIASLKKQVIDAFALGASPTERTSEIEELWNA